MPLQITLKPYELLTYLKMDPGFDDGTINTMYETAKLEAEQFLNTDFSTSVTNEDGSITITPNEAPILVKDWIFNRVAQKYENAGNFIRPNFVALQPYRVYPMRGL
jgi:hypothetical protein